MILLASMADKIADDYNIHAPWMKAIITQESRWNQYALRYEVAYQYYYKLDEFAKHPLINYGTEMMTQKMSWGLGQIMGALAREQGHDGFMGELFDPEVNMKHIAMRLKTLIAISADADDVFAMYNGGPGAIHKAGGQYKNQTYVDAVKKHLQEYQK